MNADPQPPFRFHIIGGDGAEYGPVDDAELRRWISDGRAGETTLARIEGSSEWKPLGAWPDFAEALHPPATMVDRLGVLPPPSPQSVAWLERVPELSAIRCLGEAWQLLQGNVALLVAATALNWMAQSGAALLPGGRLVLGGVLMGGLYALYLKRLRGQPAAISDAFLGFSLAFVPLLITGLVTELGTALGALCFLVPGIYLFVAWQFSLPLVMDRGLGWWHAMELSRRAVHRVWGQMLALVIVANLPTIVSFAVLSRALLTELSTNVTTGQVSFQAMSEALSRLQGPSVMHALVSLLNLPFSTAAIACAYEALFGERPTKAP